MRWCSTCNHSHLARIPANCGTENGYVAAVQRRDGEDDWAGDDSSSSMGNQFLTIESKPGEVYWEKTVLDGGRQQELWPLSWQWLYWRVSQVLFHASIAKWTSLGSRTVESPSNSTFNKLEIPIWGAWCTILFPGSVWYKKLYSGRRLGRIGSCRGEMLLSTSANWLLRWTYPFIRNHEGKKVYNFLAHLKRQQLCMSPYLKE